MTNKLLTYSNLTAITKNTPANYVAEILQKQHFINTSTDPEGCHMSNFICQNEVNMANEPLEVEQPLLQSSSEIDKKIKKIENRKSDYH